MASADDQGQTLGLLYNHLILPRRLPSREDKDPALIAQNLTQRILAAARDLRSQADEQLHGAFNKLCRALFATQHVHRHGFIDQTGLGRTLRSLEDEDFVVLYIMEQNAALIIKRCQSKVTFDAFEASASSTNVVETAGALQWDFPGSSVSVPLEILREDQFLSNLTRFLDKASRESIPQFAATIAKSGEALTEVRDTQDPSLISCLLMTLLEVNGVYEDACIVRKRVRDDVCTEAKGKPWRRSPFWLVLRVAVQQALQVDSGDKLGRFLYKILMVNVLRQFCADLVLHIDKHFEDLERTRTKIGYRMAKLISIPTAEFASLASSANQLFEKMKIACKSLMQEVDNELCARWKIFKARTRRTIPVLPARAQPNNMLLTLSHSSSYLNRILWSRDIVRPPLQDTRPYIRSPGSADMKRYFSLREEERQFHHLATHSRLSSIEVYSKALSSIQAGSNNVYEGWIEGNSVRLITMLELWVALDRVAVGRWPLLADHPIPFYEECLGVLQVSSREDMVRIRDIEAYLELRARNSLKELQTIFQDPQPHSFASRCYDQSELSTSLQQLHEAISQQITEEADKKREELRAKTEEYNKVALKESKASCLFMEDPNYIGLKVHNDRGCTKCFLKRELRRFSIDVYEYPFPPDVDQQKAICFELACPKSLALYRDTTWNLIRFLQPLRFPKEKPVIQLFEYENLAKHAQTMESRFALGSTTKPITVSHYRNRKLPLKENEVCVKCALTLAYFDRDGECRASRLDMSPSFAPFCTPTIPFESPLQSLQLDSSFSVARSGPTSNDVLASQTKCPPSSNVGEYLAYQELYSGVTLLWVKLLKELGCSNLNFSAAATTVIVSRVVLQAGPRSGNEVLRQRYWMLNDLAFCDCLLKQVSLRLGTVSSNWRESQTMESMLTIVLRVLALTSNGDIASRALSVLDDARSITIRWVRALKSEIHSAKNSALFEQRRKDVVWACLLARRTIQPSIHTESQELSLALAELWVETSIVLSQNLPDSFNTASMSVRQALIRDWCAFSEYRRPIKMILLENLQALSNGINHVWQQPDAGIVQSFEDWQLVDEEWFSSKTRPIKEQGSQTVDYNLVSGILLVNGEPMGKLPDDYRESVVVKHLFGEQPLLTYPSRLPGMLYTLAIIYERHDIHFGFRDHNLITRALHRGSGILYEILPMNIFGNPHDSDLPGPLIRNCVHWLNLPHAVLEVRPHESTWKYKDSNWMVYLNTRQAWRKDHQLVNAQSPLFKRAASIFDDFEEVNYMVLYQPLATNRSLTLHLPRMDLMFRVKQGLLFSRELQAEIDPDQDAGAWYGLRSKLVLRHPKVRALRSIIVPIGLPPIVRKFGIHVWISIPPSKDYARFSINSHIGQLECAAEPTLIYLRALFHALTSFCIPDPLTGLSGTQQALTYLQLANAKPWTPLHERQQLILTTLARATPCREFYPQGTHSMQRVTWDDSLTTTIQNEELQGLVEAILSRSRSLALFTAPQIAAPIETSNKHHLPILTRRAIYRSGSSQRQNVINTAIDLPHDSLYASRDSIESSSRRLFVAEVSRNLKDWSQKLVLPTKLLNCASEWATLRGFVGMYETPTLVDTIDINFAQEFGPIANLCRRASRAQRYDLMFMFALMAFGQYTDIDVVRALIAFVTLDAVRNLEPPGWSEYESFVTGEHPSMDWLEAELQPSRLPSEHEDTLRNDPRLTRKEVNLLTVEVQQHEATSKRQLATLIQHLITVVWPEPCLDGASPQDYPLINCDKAFDLIRADWQRLGQNFQLSEYFSKLHNVFRRHGVNDVPQIPVHFRPARQLRPRESSDAVIPTLLTLAGSCHFRKSRPTVFQVDQKDLVSNANTRQQRQYETQHSIEENTMPKYSELREIFTGFANTENLTRRQYGQDLARSLDVHLERVTQASELECDVSLPELLSQQRAGLTTLKSSVEAMEDALRADSRSPWLTLAGLWPRCTPMALLKILALGPKTQLGEGVYEALTSLALTLTSVQKLARIELAVQQEKHQIVQSEMSNEGHTNWSPSDYPEWLVLEVEANLLIRPKQVEVALATISPDSKANSVLQMNMGEGKTSCIIPMAAAILAHSAVQVRVIVPKALLPQMAQVLQKSLGGILSRPTTHIPYSRRTPSNDQYLATLAGLHEDTRKQKGVMLALPEHLMSFKLSGLQRLVDGKTEEARKMIAFQNFLNSVSRDILDESDFTLSARTQLIYPSGAQKAVDGHPDRWQTVEKVLHMAQNMFWNVQKQDRKSLEIDSRSGECFPNVYFLQRKAEDRLVQSLASDLCQGTGSIIHAKELEGDIAESVHKFISQPKISSQRLASLQTFFPRMSRTTEWKNILLLRGLLVHRILILGLKKRWNVQYGLHPARDPISVPYHAKGIPSETAEWGHPDVAILLTCLSFYFAGLTQAQMRQSLSHILKSDDRGAEYERWLSGSPGVPESLRDCNAINMDDETQVNELWILFRYSTIAIDHFLNNFVFPRHAKQFEHKLQASGWDIPLVSGSNDISRVAQEKKEAENQHRVLCPQPGLTTGFSGTNDNRTLLPLTIKQNDLPALHGTNAEVLSYLLEERNRGYVLAAGDGRRLPELSLLHLFHQKHIRVFIDAGAQILESDNLTLVQEWLKIDYQRPAAVYFDRNDKAMLVHRNGHYIPLLGSPYQDDLENCLVYLDEAHTRGTDLKLPAGAAAALTLGPGQTKDHTVQAAMRLRQLGTTQSVVFYAPPEVHQSILDVNCRPSDYSPDSSDVVRWVCEQTCRANEQLKPLYFSQGANFCNRSQAARDQPDMLTNKKQCQSFVRKIQQQENHSLSQLYMPISTSKTASKTLPKYTSPDLIEYAKELDLVRQSFEDTGEAVQAIALQEVEQEREVAVEAETVRAIDKPPHRKALPHPNLDDALRQFCEDGRARWKLFTILPALTYLRSTSVGKEHAVYDSAQNTRLYVTRDFTRTVELPAGVVDDAYARPVNWILWSMIDQIAIVVSPHEAEKLVPILRKAKDPQTHLLTYSAPVTRKMLCFDDLNYYAIPPLPDGWKAPQWLRREIGIFAGKLYFKFEDYTDLCRYLNVKPKIAGSGAQIDEMNQSKTPSAHLRTERPLHFLQQWISMRRRGQDFSHTPMGFVVQSKELDPSHPFFAEDDDARRAADGVAAVPVRTVDEASSDEEQAVGGAEDDLDDAWSGDEDVRDEVDGGVDLGGGTGTEMFDSANDLFEE
ncbi:MAG: hypothetical protein Q9162_005738 [Coniocarpon cinnabarinum]